MEDWHVKNPVWYPWVEVWNGFAITWLMPLMFVISGASLFYAVGKGSAGRFVKDKALRLLVPLVVGMFTHASLQVYLERLTHGQFSGTYFQFYPHYFRGFYEGDNPAAGNFALTGMHLWYLFWLFLFSLLLYPLLRWLKGRGCGVLSWVGRLLALPGVVYALALPPLLFSALVDPSGPVLSMSEAGWPVLIYLWLILAGFLLVSGERVQASVRRLGWWSLALAVASLLTGGYLDLRFGEPSLGTALLSLRLGLRALCSWWWVLAFLGLSMRYLERSTPFVRHANEAVLPFYIFHQTVLLCLGYLVVQWNVPGVVRWVVILLASFAIIMVLYEFLVRRFGVLRFLFGMRIRSERVSVQSGRAVVAE